MFETSRAGSEDQARRTADEVARRSYGKLVAFLAARTRDLDAAEDALSEAFARALEDWPRNGCPQNPEGWLLTVARRKAIDAMRGQRRGELLAGQLKTMMEGLEAAEAATEIPDERLALLFACAHPAIDKGVRSPLMLQVVLGLDAAAIASAFLVAPATMGQRLVRAKNKIRQAGIPFSVPGREELCGRVDTVLQAIYAAFAEGWSDGAGTDAARRELSEEAIFLGRVVAELMPEQPEALGLLALMLYAEARSRARRTARGEYVPFEEQDPSLWDSAMVRKAEELLRRASQQRPLGRFQLEAAVQSAHVERRLTGRDNWAQVVALYDLLLELESSPVVELNRAVAVGKLSGAAAGLRALDRLRADSRLADYQPYWAARADLLAGSGAISEAREAYDRAIGLERDPAVRRFLEERRAMAGSRGL